MTNLDSILKSRDNTWPTKVHLIRAMVFPVVMYGCESYVNVLSDDYRIVGVIIATVITTLSICHIVEPYSSSVMCLTVRRSISILETIFILLSLQLVFS